MPTAALSVPLRALPLVLFKCPTAQICVLWQLKDNEVMCSKLSVAQNCQDS
jgi:hypothetical protein